ncbi:sprT-like domain-containing protein Spartan [Fopius arisanus]|uniref:C1orf124_1 protein n=1 Tax=Fopius arisanus TaxID=64838 RepID=A0A0C9QQP7_9HYME|nr:PREDICTED: sprT-like domain-containing protein Spartan [Fopius arisanus]
MSRKGAKELKVMLFRLDEGGFKGAPIPQGLLPFVGLALGNKPPLSPLVSTLNQEFFDGAVRGYTFVWTKTRKGCFGHTDFLRKIVFIQECLLTRGLCRSVFIRVLLHEMIHAYLDITGCSRLENGKHGPDFKEKVKELNKRLNCDLLDDGDVDWDRLEPASLKKKFECNRCGKKVMRTISRPLSNLIFMPWYDEHDKSCGGSFILTGTEIRPCGLTR